MAEKILVLLVVFILGMVTSFLLYGKLMQIGLRHLPGMRVDLRDKLDEMDMQDFQDEERK